MPEVKVPAAKKAPAKKAPAKKAESKAKAQPSAKADNSGGTMRVKADPTVKYIDSGLYNPKAEHTVKSWEEVKAKLPCTIPELEEANKNHKNQGFVGYLIGRRAIVPEGTDLASLRKPKSKPKADDKAE